MLSYFYFYLILTVIDMCASNPCKHGGTCTQLAGGYECTCTWAFSGPTCEEQSCDLTRNDLCYVLSTEQVTWYSALQICRQAGGTLAEVCDGETNDQLFAVMDGKFFQVLLCANRPVFKLLTYFMYLSFGVQG